jgi:nuclear pore complex protein Nup107
MPVSSKVDQTSYLTSCADLAPAMDANTTREQRAEALNRARSHNLDVATIAKETVRLTLEDAFAVSPLIIPL